MDSKKKKPEVLGDLEKEMQRAEERMQQLKEDLEHVEPEVIDRVEKIVRANAEASKRLSEEKELDLELDFFDTASEPGSSGSSETPSSKAEGSR